MGIVLGLIAIAIGALMAIKPAGFLSVFGTMDWAEANLSGGSIAFYKILGVIIILGGILGATGLFGKLLLGIISSLFGSALKNPS